MGIVLCLGVQYMWKPGLTSDVMSSSIISPLHCVRQSVDVPFGLDQIPPKNWTLSSLSHVSKPSFCKLIIFPLLCSSNCLLMFSLDRFLKRKRWQSEMDRKSPEKALLFKSTNSCSKAGSGPGSEGHVWVLSWLDCASDQLLMTLTLGTNRKALSLCFKKLMHTQRFLSRFIGSTNASPPPRSLTCKIGTYKKT